MNSLCDGHVARGLVCNNVNGFSDVFWMCFAYNCAYVMSLWLLLGCRDLDSCIIPGL
jgi:hypothetical protein